MSAALPFAQLAAQFQTVRVATTCWLRESKANASGLAPISLRITVEGTRIECSTGIRVAVPVRDETGRILTPGGWDEKRGVVRGSGKLVATQNGQLALLKAHVHELVNLMKAHGRPVTARTLKRQLAAPSVGKALTFLELCERQLTGFYASGNQATYAQKRYCLSVFTRWVGSDSGKLLLEDFTPDKATQFYHWLLREVSANTANVVVCGLNTLYGCAVKMGEVEIGQNPFRLLKRRKQASAPRTRLSVEELAALREAELTGGPALARDVYLAQYYLHGSRVGAVLMLRWQDIAAGYVSLQAEKSGPLKHIPVYPELARVLARHSGKGGGLVFPLLPAAFHSLTPIEQYKARKSAVVRLNEWLGQAGAAAGIASKLHTHTARHTLALHAADSGGLAVAQAMLGHTDQKQTEVYVGALRGSVLEAAEQALYGAGEGGKVVPLWKGGEAA